MQPNKLMRAAPPNIQSPAAGNTVGTTFKVIGTYDPNDPDIHGVQARLDDGNWVPGTLLGPARPVWFVEFAGVTADNTLHTVEVRFVNGNGAQVGAPASVGRLKIKAAPKLTVARPIPHEEVPATAVTIVIDFPAGHGLATINVVLENVNGRVYNVATQVLIAPTDRQWTEPAHNGAPADEGYKLVVTGNDGNADVITVTEGGLKLT